MRHRIAALVAAVLFASVAAPLGVGAGQVAGAAAVQPVKVVVVVGPTHELTASYLAWGEEIALRAESHGAQVVRVFHPHATWEAVSAAAAGAGILVYLGHGNGFPSPYTTALMPDRQDGMGLDPVDGASDSQVQYYGEQYVRTLALAPNSVVLLNHLCYASGNSEPGQPDPSQSVAVQRVDNFAAGFLAAGAAAVVALGHQDAGDILDALFGPSQTIDQVFSTVGGIGTYQFTVPSARTPGASLHLDPESPTGYYRSVAGNLALLSSAVVGRTGAAGTPPGSMPPPGSTPPGSSPPADPPPASPPSLLPAPVAPPQPPELTSLSAPAVFTPNGDGISDTLAVAYASSAADVLDVSIANAAGATIRYLVVAAQASGRFAWDGRGDDGAIVPDGGYVLTVTPRSAVGTGTARSVASRVLTAIRSPFASPTLFYPLDGDGTSDRVVVGFTLTRPATVTWRITDASGRAVRTLWLNRAMPAGQWSATWNGQGLAPGAKASAPMPEGRYFSAITAKTTAGSLLMRAAITLGAFRLTPSSTSVSAGQPITLSILSAEPLGTAPTVTVTQPGLAAYPVPSTRVGRLLYRASIVLQPGAPGPVSLAVAGVDVARHPLTERTTIALR